VTELRIAKELSLPLDCVTQKLAFLGRTGSGKTYGAKRMVEQMLRAGAQVIILDPVGVWPGLRLGPKAIDIPVLGGLFGDIPLESTSGALVADLIVDTGTSMVLDVSQMRDAERTRFATAFAERLFQRKKAAPSAVHIVLEECQEFVPQNPQPGEQRMLHEFQHLAKLGRNFGIGLSLITQRPQEVAKKALNQSECIFAFQLTGPHERKALEYWLSDKGLGEKLSDLLPKLKVGAPHIWSPQWLQISKVVHILPIDTQDTSQTPKVGDAAEGRRTLKAIDMPALKQAMAAAVERDEQENPERLRARIAELESQLETEVLPSEPIRVEVPVVNLGLLNGLREAVEREVSRLFGTATKQAMGELDGAKPLPFEAPLRDCYVDGCTKPGGHPGKHSYDEAPYSDPPRSRRAEPPTAPKDSSPARPVSSAAGFGAGEAKILTAVAQHHSGVTREQLSVLTGYKRSSRDTYLQRLRATGAISINGVTITATAAGSAALGSNFTRLPTGSRLREHWLSSLPEGESRILAIVCQAFPRTVTKDKISEATDYKRSSRDTYLQRLKARQLVVVSPGFVVANPDLFDRGEK
jgi:hypothetical protein